MSVKKSAIQSQVFLQQHEKKMLLHRHAFASSIAQFCFDILATLILIADLRQTTSFKDLGLNFK